MLRNYLLTACRTLARNQVYSMINIAGLAVSIASCLILFYIIDYEMSFDAFHDHHERIYRIVNEVQFDEGMHYGEGVPAPLPEAVRTDFPQLKEVGTILSIPSSQIDVLNAQENDQATFKEDLGVFFAEPQFFNIFSFGWLHGSPASLNEPNTVVLTRQIAVKYFGDWKKAIGKSIEYQNRDVLKVTGILEDLHGPTDFPLKVVIAFKTRGQEANNWGNITSRRQCFVLLDEHTTREQVQAQMPAFEKKHQPADVRDHYKLQSLEDVHFDERYGNFNNRTASKANLLALALIGVLLIVTASINFVNLAIAQLIKRAKEVGIRKVLGSNRWQLAAQVFGEIVLILVASTLLALLISQTTLPILQTVLRLPASFRPSEPSEVIIFLILINVVIAVLSGFYPARVMGAFKPVQAIKSRISSHTLGGVPLRKGLVVVQFAIAQVLVIATLVILQQLDFFRSAPLGFDKDAVVAISLPLDSASRTRFESFRHSLLQHPEVINTSFSLTFPLSVSSRRGTFHFDHAPDDSPFEANLKYADPAFFSIYDLSLRTGRFYQPSDTAREFVVNETFLKRLGVNNPEEGLGKTITINGATLPIVGVVTDFHMHSLKEQIEPLIMMCGNSQYRIAGVKLLGGNTKQTIQDLKKLYHSYFPGHVFEYQFLDDDIAKQYEDEERLSSISKIFSGIAIFISCLGLYGLISFIAAQRTKEIGVRKVLGASAKDIVVLFAREFVFLVLIAFTISAPLTAYFMSDWLNSFAYRIDLSPWVFILAMALSLIVSLSTISLQSLRAALSNPVDALKNE